MPYPFDISEIIKRARSFVNERVKGVSIELPFISFEIDPADLEKQVARELVIRLTDKRVLKANECCDGCIKSALESIQEIRKLLVEKQVALAAYHEGGLYLLIDLMAEVIRQFLTYEEAINAGTLGNMNEHQKRESYFELLNGLRFHMHSCIAQLAKVGAINTPKVQSFLKHDDAWMLSLYIQPPQLTSDRA